MKQTTSYTGQLGAVLLLDQPTEKKMACAASDYHASNAIDVGGRHIPHISLYHSKLRAVPDIVIDWLLDELIIKLPIALAFTEIAPFGGKFLFWNIERSTPLTGAHERALYLSRYFIPTGEQQADREKIALLPEEQENVKTYGHPLVQKLWQPHVTLGYAPGGLAQNTATKRFIGNATGAAFVRIGEAGTIAEIISKGK